MDSERMRREKQLSYNVTGNVEFQLSGKVCNRRKLKPAQQHDRNRRRGVVLLDMGKLSSTK
jgi:predicted pyridoxine 5'-phosphate oxidase superfamily flavin-nucleotide-binding protein